MTVFETYGVISYGSGWRKDVVNQCLEFDVGTVFSRDKLLVSPCFSRNGDEASEDGVWLP